MSHTDPALLRERIELEHSIADCWDDLEFLRALFARCATAARPAACRQAIQTRIDRKIARIARLKRRQSEITEALGKEG